jgi:hypothetical protein
MTALASSAREICRSLEEIDRAVGGHRRISYHARRDVLHVSVEML